MGVGLGLLTGSGLRLLAPRITTLLGDAVDPPSTENAAGKTTASVVAKGLKQARFAPRQEIRALSERWLELAAQQSDLQASAYMLILDDGRFAAMQAERPMAAASSIKTPILLAVLELLDQNTAVGRTAHTHRGAGGGRRRMDGLPAPGQPLPHP